MTEKAEHGRNIAVSKYQTIDSALLKKKQRGRPPDHQPDRPSFLRDVSMNKTKTEDYIMEDYGMCCIRHTTQTRM